MPAWQYGFMKVLQVFPSVKEVTSMPTYEYRCTKCKRDFSLTMSMAAHDTETVRCPACQNASVVQQYSTFYAKTSKKS